MKHYDHAAQLHEAVLLASLSNDSNIRTAYFDLAAFHYRHVDTSGRLGSDIHALTKLAEECCHERHCWCTGDDH